MAGTPKMAEMEAMPKMKMMEMEAMPAMPKMPMKMTAEQQAEQDAINAKEMGVQMKMKSAEKVGPMPMKGVSDEGFGGVAGVGYSTMKSPAVATKKPGYPPDGEETGYNYPAKGKSMPAQSSSDLTLIVAAVNNLNATFNKLLSSIENRLKKNDVIPQLKTMTKFISEINDSLPEPSYGGGTRRSRMKKGKKTLRNRRA